MLPWRQPTVFAALAHSHQPAFGLLPALLEQVKQLLLGAG